MSEESNSWTHLVLFLLCFLGRIFIMWKWKAGHGRAERWLHKGTYLYLDKGGSIFGEIQLYYVFMFNSYRIETCPSGQEFAIYVPTFLVPWPKPLHWCHLIPLFLYFPLSLVLFCPPLVILPHCKGSCFCFVLFPLPLSLVFAGERWE